MITTRESINYQFSLIFGYSSPKDIIAGNVLGPGKLTRKKVNQLSSDVIKFLRMYNAILRDYTGSELFYIEFELFNVDEKDARVNIYPKSMLLIPGKYKECESLLLALKPDTGYIDTHISKASLDDICKLFYEVEEFTDHPELDFEEKSNLLNNFAERFSKKLYGELLEDKWNKKLIGISISLPTDKEMLNSYGSIKSEIEILWNKNPYELNFLNPSFEKMQSPFDDHMKSERLKYLISKPSANFVVKNTLKLGTNLMKLAKTGTIDESQDKILFYLLNEIRATLSKYQDNWTNKKFLSFFEGFALEMVERLNQFLIHSKSFLSSGKKGDLTYLLNEFKNFMEIKIINKDYDFRDFYNLAYFSINQYIKKEQELLAVDLSSVIDYFSEIFKHTLNLIKKALPRFIYLRELILAADLLIQNLFQKFHNEQQPASTLGINLISKYGDLLKNNVEFNSITLSDGFQFNLGTIIRIFKNIATETLSNFLNNSRLNISDLVSFAEVQMESNVTTISSHLIKFKKFSNELRFLANYILRYSTINRFLKEKSELEIADPVSFATKFFRFLEKRIGGFNLVWKSYLLDWVKDYAKKFFKIDEQRNWKLIDTFSDFIEYMRRREAAEQDPKNFLIFLDAYIPQITNEIERQGLMEFYQQFENSINITSEFPKYVQNKIETEVNLLSLDERNEPPINFLEISKEKTLYRYIKENELEYFSKLIPRPKNIILKHNLTNEEKDLFKGNLFHVISFNYWHKKSKFDISDNFKEVYREWAKL